MNPIQFRVLQYIFKPSLIGSLAALVCIPLFINLGFWQYHKAQEKMSVQFAYNQAKVGDALVFPAKVTGDEVANIDGWKYRKVRVTGTYDTKYQFLLDNQVEGDRVGYHVITPLKIEGSSQYVLVNRGWILGKDTHTELPKFNTPLSQVTLTGQVWVPSKKIFTLEDKSISSSNTLWQAVWQNMDMAKYKQSVPFSVSAMVIRLDSSNSTAGGFERNWQVPAERIATNIGYAYQWFGFALATLLIYIYMSFTSVKQKAEVI